MGIYKDWRKGGGEVIIEGSKNFVLNGDARFFLTSKESGIRYEYRVRLPRSSGRKGLYFVTVNFDHVWLYAGHFWRSSLHLLRGHKSVFSENDDPMKTFEAFLSGLRERYLLNKEKEAGHEA
jgi:hypothetical protein